MDALHEAHVRAFTFDNIDLLLGTHPGVDLDAVQQKFVTRGGVATASSTRCCSLQRFGWELMRTTDELTVHPVDLAMGHHFTSTHPGSHFTQALLATRHLDRQHLTVAHGAVTRGGQVSRPSIVRGAQARFRHCCRSSGAVDDHRAASVARHPGEVAASLSVRGLAPRRWRFAVDLGTAEADTDEPGDDHQQHR